MPIASIEPTASPSGLECEQTRNFSPSRNAVRLASNGCKASASGGVLPPELSGNPSCEYEIDCGAAIAVNFVLFRSRSIAGKRLRLKARSHRLLPRLRSPQQLGRARLKLFRLVRM